MDFQVITALSMALRRHQVGASNLQELPRPQNTLNQLRSLEGQAQEAYNAAQVKVEPGPRGLKDVCYTSAAVDLRSFPTYRRDGPGFRRPLLIAPRTR